jgi:hypothetical protein
MREDSEVHSGTGVSRGLGDLGNATEPPGRSRGIRMKNVRKQTVRHPDLLCGSHPTVRVRHRPSVCLEQCRAVVGHPRAGPSLAGRLLAGPLLAGRFLVRAREPGRGRRKPAQRKPRRGLGRPILVGRNLDRQCHHPLSGFSISLHRPVGAVAPSIFQKRFA